MLEEAEAAVLQLSGLLLPLHKELFSTVIVVRHHGLGILQPCRCGLA